MLSQDKIDKLCMTGIYSCTPVEEWRDSQFRDSLYWCCNWIFKVRERDGVYYMHDTYWSGHGGLCVELTDDNFDKFEFLFDMEKVKRILPEDYEDYNEDDKWFVALDSGGWQYSKYYYVKENAQKDKKRVQKRLQREIDALNFGNLSFSVVEQ